MKIDILPFIYFGAYFILFVATTVGLAFWLIKRRTEMPPVEFKLLRAPGETLRRRVQKFDEGAGFYAVGAAMVPVIVGLIVLRILTWLAPDLRLLYTLIITGVIALGTLAFSGRWLVMRVLRAREDRLGFLGERAVAEALHELIPSGYRVFHDVPTEKGELESNVDHVAVGPMGIFVIETKSRRKGVPRPGADQYKVTYDENRLIWPWNEDDLAPRQTTERARWLSYWVKQTTGVDLAAIPVLAIPGWYVETAGAGPVLVVNHKQLVETITRMNSAGTLTTEQIDQIAHQLEDRCRDVED